MKAIKIFAALFAAATLFTACEDPNGDNGGVTPPVITPDEKPAMPEVAEVEGAYNNAIKHIEIFGCAGKA